MKKINNQNNYNKIQRFSIRKYSFGAASVAIASYLMFMGNGAVYAAGTEGAKPQAGQNQQLQNEAPKAVETAEEKAQKELATSKEKLAKYVTEIEGNLTSGKYNKKTEASLSLLRNAIAQANQAANATTVAEVEKAHANLVTTVITKLKTDKSKNNPPEEKPVPGVDTTNGKPTVGKKAENTEPTSGTNSIENSGSHDSRNGKVMNNGVGFRTDRAATTPSNEITTTANNISYTIAFSDVANKVIYLYNEEDADINITIDSTTGKKITAATVKKGSGQYLDGRNISSPIKPEETDGFGWSYHSITDPTTGPVTVSVTGKPNDAFKTNPKVGYTKAENQNAVLGDRYLHIIDEAGGTISGGTNAANPGYFKLVVKSQTYKYDIKDLTDERRITVNDIDNITPTDLTTIKSRLQLEHSKTSNDARFVGGTAVANPTSLIDTVAVSTTEPSKLVVTYVDGSVDTIEKSKVLNVRPKGVFPFSNPTAKEIYVYKGEETNLEFGVTDDSGKIKDLRIVQGSANISNSGAARGQIKNEYGLTMTSETNENGIVATTANPAITRITGTVSVPGKPNYVGPLMTRYLVAEDLEGAVFSYPDANKNLDQEGAFKLVVREQT